MTDALRKLDEDTAIVRGVTQTMTMLSNLDEVGRHPHWSALGKPLAGKTAFIVGAGPSLDRNVEHLRNAKGCVFAVNSSGPALAARGIRIDVLVSTEPVCVADHLARSLPVTKAVALSLSSHADAWAACEGKPAVWLTSGGPESIEVCEILDVPPLLGGGAAVQSAFSLALAWGASTIVLVGHDLAYTGLRAYAEGAGWDGLECSGTADELTFTGRPDRDEAHRAAGVAGVPRKREVVWVPSWRGLDDEFAPDVPTTWDYEAQRQWYAQQAEWLDVNLVNATEGGALIGGWYHAPLKAWAPEGRRVDMARRIRYADTCARPDAVRDELLERVKASEDLAWRMAGRKPLVGCRGLLSPSAAIEMAAQGTIILDRRNGVKAAERIDRTYAAYLEMAQLCRESLSSQDEATLGNVVQHATGPTRKRAART